MSRSRWLGVVCCLIWLLPAVAQAEAPKHDRSFWRGIVEADFAVPEGESAVELLAELSSMLGSPDPEFRDEFGYAITARWVYRDRLFGADDLRPYLAEWSANLERGIGEVGTESVLLRSFSALNLSILAAYDNLESFMTEAEYQALLESALGYFASERDLRGHLKDLGWVHPLAHTADLLKFLARSSKLEASQQRDILAALASRTVLPNDAVYTWGEGERFARVALAVVLRPDFDPEGLDPWLEGLAAKAEGLWEGSFDVAQYAEVQNARSLLLNLHLMLEAVEEPAPAVEEAKLRVAEAAGSL